MHDDALFLRLHREQALECFGLLFTLGLSSNVADIPFY